MSSTDDHKSLTILFLWFTAEVRQHRSSTGDLDPRRHTNLSRSRSAQSLKNSQDPQVQDDKLTIMLQLFWVAVSLLESDYEYEFLLAVRLLDNVSDCFKKNIWDISEQKINITFPFHDNNWALKL